MADVLQTARVLRSLLATAACLAEAAAAQSSPTLLLDIRPGSVGSGPANFLTSGSTSIFDATSPGGRAVWRSDGTAAGTRAVGAPLGFDATVAGAAFVHLEPTTGGTRLVARDPSGASRLLLSAPTIQLDRAVGIGERLYFVADDGVNGSEVWWTDGRRVRLLDLATPSGGSAPYLLGAVGGRCGFLADPWVGSLGFYTTDGRVGGTVRWPGFTTATAPGTQMAVGDDGTVFLVDDVGALYVGRDPAVGFTQLLPPSQPAGYVRRIVECVGSTLVYTDRDARNGNEPWRTDGTPGGTGLLVDGVPGPGDSSPLEPFRTGGRLAWIAEGGVWVTDGTPAGTTLVHPTNQFTTLSGTPWFELADGRLVLDTVLGQDPATRGTWEIDVGARTSRRLARSFLPQQAVQGVLLGALFDRTFGAEVGVWAPGPLAVRRGLPCGAGRVAPRLAGDGPALGGSLVVRGASPPPLQSGVLLLGASPRTQVPLGNGCALQIDPSTSVAVASVPAGTAWQRTFPVPRDPALAGATVVAQAVYGPSALRLRLELSNGVEFTIR